MEFPAAPGTLGLQWTLYALVLPGHNVRIATLTIAGAPTFALVRSTEVVL